MIRTNLPSLTILRGPAALFVFIYHIVHNTDWIPSKQIFSVGYIGVSLFFVLSGFVLTWSYNYQQGKKDYYRRRLSRIYPLHLFFLMLAVVLPVTAGDRDILKFLTNILLIQSWIPSWDYIFSFNSVSWSLACEVFFYAMLPFLLPHLNKMQGYRSLLLLGIAIVVIAGCGSVVASRSNYLDVVIYVNPFFRSAEFLLGILTAFLVKRVVESERSGFIHWRREILYVFQYISLLAIFLAVYFVAQAGIGQTISGYLLAPVFAIFILVSALKDIKLSLYQEHTGALRQGIRKVLVYLGEVSFAFYLAHELIILNLEEYLGTQGEKILGGGISFIVCLLTSLLISIAAHHLVEKPARKKLLERF